MSRRFESMGGRVLPAFLIVTSFLALVVLVATPSYENVLEEDRALAVKDLVTRVEAACRRHHQDTGKLALEYAARNEEDSYNAKRYHHLATAQLYAGWQGPYLDLPLSQADNPWGGTVELRDNLSTHPALGFELAGGKLAHERGQYLLLTGVPEASARIVERVFDGEPGESWADSGRVEYVVDDGGTLSIFLLALGD
ncbi:MAG: hypothetical protein H6807_09715 [Planctomycetes bacterium]|nr:hypothetical protein [Planctomycetota bacterium]